MLYSRFSVYNRRLDPGLASVTVAASAALSPLLAVPGAARR